MSRENRGPGLPLAMIRPMEQVALTRNLFHRPNELNDAFAQNVVPARNGIDIDVHSTVHDDLLFGCSTMLTGSGLCLGVCRGHGQ